MRIFLSVWAEIRLVKRYRLGDHHCVADGHDFLCHACGV